MNFDLETKEGMENAVIWTNNALSMIKDGGVWMIPRSGTVYIIDHKTKTAQKTALIEPDESVDRVLAAAGWKVVDVRYGK